jgi:membrane-bound metal-dependent hydrolase YbcI (DUF457 family)
MLKNFKPWVQFGILNALAGIGVGIYITTLATGYGYFTFIFAGPLAAFITGGLFWKLFHGEEDNIAAISSGVFTGVFSHYIAWVLVSIGMNICYWTTGNCTDSLGSPPMSVVSMLGTGFLYSAFSLVIVGWITIPASIIIGIILKKRLKSQETDENDK